MLKSKKYDLRVVEVDGSWAGQITRRMTARKTIVSKEQAGFETEQQAQDWAEQALQSFLEGLVERNDRKAKARGERTEALIKKEREAQAWRDARDGADDFE
ncbi:DUF3622 domain-containing protein [Shewanella waksmanii]|uniref:DUF3622 domain-containing protein n=1 Tax=Shewanella waksmanii TaxID=213783 RepID=UPI003735D524